MSFTIFDIIILSILTASSILGIYRGFVRVSINFAALILSLLMAYHLYSLTEDFFSKHIENEIILKGLSGIISYILSLAICSYLSSKLIEIVRNMTGGVADRFLGLIAGFVRGSIICIIVFIITVVISTKSYNKSYSLKDIYNASSEDKYPCWLTESLTTKNLNNVTKYLMKHLPTEYLDQVKLPINDESEDDPDLSEEKSKGQQTFDDLENEVINKDLDRELNESLQ